MTEADANNILDNHSRPWSVKDGKLHDGDDNIIACLMDDEQDTNKFLAYVINNPSQIIREK